MTKKPVFYVEKELITIVVDYKYELGYYSEHDVKNDLLDRIQKAIHKDYPITRFNVMNIAAPVKQK